jgi:hypothetical protein
MNQDTIWQLIRYALIAVGSFVVGKGYITSEQVTTIVGAIGAIFPIVWGLYVKAGTKATTVEAAQRTDVPTVSGATGAVTK